MRRFTPIIPAFWDETDTGIRPLSLKRKWLIIVCFTSFMVLLPLVVMTLMEFRLSRQVIEDQIKKGMGRTVITLVRALEQDGGAMSPENGARLIQNLSPDPEADIFLTDMTGTLLTASRFLGPAGTVIPPPSHTRGITLLTLPEKGVFMASGRPENSSVMVVQAQSGRAITDLWLSPRLNLMVYLCVSIFIILVSIAAMATYLVGRIHRVNRQWIETLHHEEHANRLASIGRLASGVAHEINNPLEIINQKTGLMLDLLGVESQGHPRLKPLANDVLDAVKRCSTITRQLLNFARHMEPSIEAVNIPEILEQILTLLKPEAEQKGIAVRVAYPENLPVIYCDRSSLQQIFLNLGENAVAAMEDGGKLTICIKESPGAFLTISISDTGKGISPEDQKKIFEPFFSTREEGWGAGLGLAITYGLMREMGGDIKVHSEPGKGARFVLSLPHRADLPEDPGSLHLPGQSAHPGCPDPPQPQKGPYHVKT